MKKLLATAVAGLLVATFANMAVAGEAKKAYPAAPAMAAEPAMPAKAKVRQVTGLIVALDTQAGTLTITKTVKGKPMDYALSTTAKTRLKGIKALADLRLGDKVMAKYVEQESALVAKSIELRPPKKAKKATETKS